MSSILSIYLMQGWTILSESNDFYFLQRKQKQSVGVHIVLLLFTWGIGNIIYFLVKNNPETLTVPKEKEQSNV
jgi:hypothetical protein